MAKTMTKRTDKIKFLKSKNVKVEQDEEGEWGVAIKKGKQCLTGKAFHNDHEREDEHDNGEDVGEVQVVIDNGSRL